MVLAVHRLDNTIRFYIGLVPILVIVTTIRFGKILVTQAVASSVLYRSFYRNRLKNLRKIPEGELFGSSIGSSIGAIAKRDCARTGKSFES